MKKLQRYSCLFFILLMTFSVYGHWQGNWLVGVAGGYSQHNGALNIGLIFNGPKIPPNYSETDLLWNGRGKEWTKGLLVGYRSICDRWVLDGEVNVDLYQPDKDFLFYFVDVNENFVFSSKRRYKHGPAFGITGRFGYVMAPYFIPYLVAGLETNKDKLEVTIIGEGLLYSRALVIADSEQQVRGIIGFGVEFPLIKISPCFSLRLEYNYHSMDKALNAQGSINDGAFNPQFAMNLRPKFNSGKAALIWNFA